MTKKQYKNYRAELKKLLDTIEHAIDLSEELLKHEFVRDEDNNHSKDFLEATKKYLKQCLHFHKTENELFQSKERFKE